MTGNGSKPSHRKEQIWVCVVAGLFLCDFVVCGYLPSQQRLTSLQQARAHQQRTIDLGAAQGVELARLKTRLRDMERVVERFDASVPPDRALGGFLQQIAAIMVEYELTDQAVLPGKESVAGDLCCIPVHLTCKGTLTQLFGFFNRLQALDRLVRIEAAMFQNDAGFDGQLNLEADLVIFYQSTRLRTDNTARMQSADEVNHGA
ncbi:MAG: type 4a pilus biogenesis protein PilO [Phycisphaerales bacterium]